MVDQSAFKKLILTPVRLSAGELTEMNSLPFPTLRPVAIIGLLMAGSLLAQNKKNAEKKPAHLPHDAVEEAQSPRVVAGERPEQTKSSHDADANRFKPDQAPPVNAAVKDQPMGGAITGFDFYRDPLNAEKPMQTLGEIMTADKHDKSAVMEAQRKLLEARYHLELKAHPTAKMSRGKAVPVGPTAKLKEGKTWADLDTMKPEDIKQEGVFPYPALPHPKQVAGGQVFPAMQIEMFPRLQRYDVDFDIPDAFLPEFPPAIFLQSRPELGDVSRGEVVSINNYYKLFKDLLSSAVGWPAPPPHSHASGGIQCHRRPQDGAAEPGGHLL